MTRCLWVVLSVVLMANGASGREATSTRVILCSEEAEQLQQGLSAEIARYLTFSVVAVSAYCPAQREAGVYVAGLVVAQDGTARLELATHSAPSRSRQLSWVRAGSPMAETLSQAKVPALALLIEAMLLEFEEVQPPQAPFLLPPAPAALVDPEAEPRDQSSAARYPISPTHGRRRPGSVRNAGNPQYGRVTIKRPVEPRRVGRVGLQVAGGVSLLPEQVTAPIVALLLAFETDRWGAVLALQMELDSDFSIGRRPFDTRVYSVALGPRLKLVASGPLWLGVDLPISGTYSRYRRADLVDATTREWFGLGVGADLVARLRLMGDLWGSVRSGGHVIPTAPKAEIANGPNRSTGDARLSFLAGVDFFF